MTDEPTISILRLFFTKCIFLLSGTWTTIWKLWLSKLVKVIYFYLSLKQRFASTTITIDYQLHPLLNANAIGVRFCF